MTVFDHLDRMSDHRGLFEHANRTVPREEHGYCTDDNARLLVVMSREPDVGPAQRLGRLALHFVRGAQAVDGRCHNRMDRFGRWTDGLTTDDCWGRSLFGLGTAAAMHPNLAVRTSARLGFDRGVRQRSPSSHAMAFAALGAIEVARHDPRHGPARALLADALDVIGPISTGNWPWPEARLTYANATLAEAVIAAGAVLDDASSVDRGLTMLEWLLELETSRGHLSVTGVGGRGPNDSAPQFDQQPIEAAAMADACWRAYTITGDHTWLRGVAAAAAWFAGDNDTGLPMHDEISGGGFDGLQAVGVNLNQGAESTLAYVSTMQRVRSFAPSP
jgi:hypothetical protein